jgi:hypothetical protein
MSRSTSSRGRTPRLRRQRGTAPRRRCGRWAPGDDAIATTAAADGTLLCVIPRWQAAAAAEDDVAGVPSAADQLLTPLHIQM